METGFMERLQTTPNRISDEILNFCRTLSDKAPFYVSVHPPKWARPQQCYGNVQEAIDRAGGKAIYGWKIWEFPRVFLEAEHHSIWEPATNPGQYHDITPQIEGECRVLFCFDNGHIFQGNTVSKVRYALRDKVLVEELWFVLDRMMDIQQAHYLAGQKMDHSLLKKLGPLVTRLNGIYESLGVDVRFK